MVAREVCAAFCPNLSMMLETIPTNSACISWSMSKMSAIFYPLLLPLMATPNSNSHTSMGCLKMLMLSICSCISVPIYYLKYFSMNFMTCDKFSDPFPFCHWLK